MLLGDWLVVAGLGRILIFVWQKFPERYVPTKLLKDIHACDLCSGVYIYPVLFWHVGADIGDAILYGIITSFIVWVFVKGMMTLIEPTTYIIK